MQLQAQALCYSHVQQAQRDGYACVALQHHIDAAVVWVVVVLVIAFEAYNVAQVPASIVSMFSKATTTLLGMC